VSNRAAHPAAPFDLKAAIAPAWRLIGAIATTIVIGLIIGNQGGQKKAAR
jgi:hypothetical protein